VSKVEVSSYSFSTNYNGSRTPVFARLYASASFVTDGGDLVHFSPLGSPNFYKQAAVTVASGIITIGGFTTALGNSIDSTTRNSEQNGVTYTLVLVDAQGRPTGENNGIVFDNCPQLKVPDVLTPTTWQNIVLFSQAPLFPQRFSEYYNASQIDVRLGDLDLAPDASAIVKGRTRLSAAPLVSTDPVAVGTNDPVWNDTNETKYLSSYASLAAAITAIGATSTTLVFADEILVTANTTAPVNIRLVQQGNGRFNISTSMTLTIVNGLGFHAPGDKQIFTGAGSVYFSGSLPEMFYPEWLGAVGDGTTDDIVAFNKIPFVYPPLTRELNVHVAANKTYQCSGPWVLDNKVNVSGGGTIRFAANSSGIVVHHIGTKTGVNDGRSAENSVFKDLKLIGNGNGSASAVTSTHTVSVSGTTITRTAGASFDDDLGYIESNLININGYNYVIDSFTNANVLEIKPFALQLNATNGSPTLVCNDFRTWDVTGLWIGQDIIIDGVTYEISNVALVTGQYRITLTTNYTGTTTTYTAYIQGLAATAGLAMRPNLYHGFDLRAQCEIDRCYITAFPGNGISAGGSDSTGLPGSTPNINNAYLKRNIIFSCSGNGFFSQGVNSNQIHLVNNDFTDNRGAGAVEHGFLGNVYRSNHHSFNYSHSIDGQQNGVNGSLFVGEYVESGMPKTQLGGNMLWIAGNPGSGFEENSAFITGASGPGVILSRLLVSEAISSQNNRALMFAAGPSTGLNTLFGFGAGEETANTGAGYPVTQAKYPAYQVIYDETTGRYGWNWKENSLGIPGVSLLQMTGSQAPEGGGKLYMPTGVAITPRVTTVASSATPTPNADLSDEFTVTALATNATFGAPTGTPVNGQPLIIRILDNGTTRTLTWNAVYRSFYGAVLPPSTTISKTLYIELRWNSASSTWDCQSVREQL
jgi:hypothetical protein